MRRDGQQLCMCEHDEAIHNLEMEITSDCITISDLIYIQPQCAGEGFKSCQIPKTRKHRHMQTSFTCHSALVRSSQVTSDPAGVDTATLRTLDVLPGGCGAGETGGGGGGEGGSVQGWDSESIWKGKYKKDPWPYFISP